MVIGNEIASRAEQFGAQVGSLKVRERVCCKPFHNRGIMDGVRVNAINPGAIRTNRYAGRLRRVAAALGSTEAEAERRMVAEAGVTRIGEPEDVAGLVGFVLSRRGSYLQGALIDIDGGKTRTI